MFFRANSVAAVSGASRFGCTLIFASDLKKEVCEFGRSVPVLVHFCLASKSTFGELRAQTTKGTLSLTFGELTPHTAKGTPQADFCTSGIGIVAGLFARLG